MQFTRREEFSASASLNATMTTGSCDSSSSSSSLSSIQELVPVRPTAPQIDIETRCVWFIVQAETFYDSSILFDEIEKLVETTHFSSILCGIYLIYSPQQAEAPLIQRLKKEKRHKTPWRPHHITFCCLDQEDDFTRTATISLAFSETLSSTPVSVYSKTTLILILGNKASLAMKRSVGDWLSERHKKTIVYDDIAPFHDQIKDLIIERMKFRKKQKRKKRKHRDKLKDQ